MEMNMIKGLINKIKERELIKRIFKNTGWILTQHMVNLILGLLVNAIIARYYGAEKFGVFSYVLSITSLFSGLAAFGIHHIAIKDLKCNPEKEGQILGTSFSIRIALSLILLTLADVTVYLLSGADKTMTIIAMLLSSMMIFNSFEVIDYYINSKMKVKYSVISKIIAIISISALKMLIVIFDLAIEYYAVMYLIEVIIYAIGLCVSYKIIKKQDDEKIKWTFDRGYAKELLGKSWYFALSSIMVTIYMKIDQAMLGTIIEDKSQVGIYSAAVRIAEMWAVVPIAIITAIKPAIIEQKNTDEVKYKDSLNKLYYVISGICIIFALGITIFSKLIIYILYGTEFMAASSILYILVIGTWFGMLGNVHYVWMVCEDKAKYSMFYSFVGSASNIIINLILMPQYGALGAAIATLISQILANVFSFAVFKETRILTIHALKAIFMIDFFKDIRRKISVNN